MLIGQMPVSKIKIPAAVSARSRGREIFTMGVEEEFVPKWCDADVWITASHAWPHVDLEWRGKLFLTLCVRGSHEISDAHEIKAGQNPKEYMVKAGSLFVVDPMMPHWLKQQRSWERAPSKFVALQWEVPTRGAARKARQLIDQAGGEWIESQDTRYSDWAPVGVRAECHA